MVDYKIYCMNIIRNFLLFLALIATCSNVTSSDEIGLNIEVADYGLVGGAGSKKEIYDKYQELKVVKQDSQVVNTTTDIPLVKDVRFGITVNINSIQDLGDVPISVIILVNHPEITLPSGEKRKNSYAKGKLTLKDGKYHGTFSYRLNMEYELIPGEWTMSVIYNKEEYAKTIFNVRDATNL